jgi:hypothetical protein
MGGEPTSHHRDCEIAVCKGTSTCEDCKVEAQHGDGAEWCDGR